jgi:hypothetical protein
MPSYEASMRNLRRARARWRAPRPWRSTEEAQMIRRFVFYWFTCRDRSRPSARAWARQLGISHTWIQKLVRKFEADPNEIRRVEVHGDPKAADLNWAQECSRRMRESGELRFSRSLRAGR